MIILENHSLKEHNTFGVDASARYFAAVSTLEDLKSVMNFAKSNNLPTLMLGGGSNVLFTKNFEGVAIQINFKGIEETILSDDEVLVKAQAGENWHSFVQFCLQKNYGGLENLSLIPGNVGTSPMQNIGAYGTEIKDTFAGCTVLNLLTGETEEFSHEKCRFGYRDSVFKQEGKGKYIILEVSFRLSRRNHVIRAGYGAIQSELENMGVTNPGIQDISTAVINIRKSKLPDPKVLGNAGSFFKNPTIPAEQFRYVQERFPGIPNYPAGNLVKVPAGWLIEQCGWKGKQIGNVASHELQALVIVNKTGNASGKEIFNFSTMIIDSVKEKFGIELEREVNII